MKQVVIENPILNSPFDEPGRHYKFDEDGITDEIADRRRPSSYFIPIAAPRKKGKQLTFETQWTQDRAKENDDINFIRHRVALWRGRGHPDVTPVTRALLDYWRRPDRERRLFFCQVEALETLIYLAEAAEKSGDVGILNKLRDGLTAAGTPLWRLASKMATGSGKTVVMAMLIAWHTLNKRRAPADRRFADAFLLVTPGITMRDRLRVLLPSDPHNYYQALDLVPAEHLADLGTAKVVITNYHAFRAREQGDAGKLTRAVLSRGAPSAFSETPAQVVRRVCRELGTKKNIVVLNDEAHHCYRSRLPEDRRVGTAHDVEPGGQCPPYEKLTGDERKEAERREEAARLWITGLEAVHDCVGVRVVYDLSATPFYLKGSGYPEGTLFPWVVSDFSLIDAIESGIVKVPRVPVADNAMTGDQPTYRDLWLRIRDALPKKGRGTDALVGPPQVAQELEGALRSLYQHYEKQYRGWEADAGGRAEGRTPPVFIVVCNNTNVSKLVFDWIAGHETGQAHPDGAPFVAPGNLPIFSNVEGNRWVMRPNTILVDSEQLESDEGMSADFKKLAAAQIEEFKAEFRKRFPGRDAEGLTDEDLMREVLNTVGKAGKLGEGVRCVVSVSMLTEGWDANSVTHILGVRAFGTQLLCEQVVGRGLRRMSYTLNEQGHFDPEYAEVYGVPFSLIPCAGSGEAKEKKPGTPRPGRVKALPERVALRPCLEITYPRLTGYRYELPPARLEAAFTDESREVLTTADIPTRTENAPIVGESVIHTLDDLKKRREQEVAFGIARLVLQQYYPAGEAAGAEAAPGAQVWLFPQVLGIVRRWLAECVACKDGTFPQLLLLVEKAHKAAEKIHRAIAAAFPGERRVRAVLQPYDNRGTTAGVSYDTTKPRWTTAADRCHINFVPCDSNWEAKFAQALEEMGEVKAYVKNQNLGFKVPYPGLDGPEPTWHQAAELPRLAAQVTEYQGHYRTCPCCGQLNHAPIPRDLKAHGVGPRLAATLAYLAGSHRASNRGPEGITEDVFDVPIALGTVGDLRAEVSDALAGAHAEAVGVVRAAAVKNVDETSWKLAGRLCRLWVAATNTVAAFLIHAHRGRGALAALLGAKAQGFVCSDRCSAYDRLSPFCRQLCWAHLKRDFQKLVDRGGAAAPLGRQLQRIAERVFVERHLFRGGGRDRRELQLRLDGPARAWERALKAGRRCADSKAAAFCENVLALLPAVWRFVVTQGVGPTNNQAGRVLRRGVLWRKNALGCQSEAGCRFVERMLTAVQTRRLQGRSVLGSLYDALVAHRNGLPAPSLLPAD